MYVLTFSASRKLLMSNKRSAGGVSCCLLAKFKAERPVTFSEQLLARFLGLREEGVSATFRKPNLASLSC